MAEDIQDEGLEHDDDFGQEDGSLERVIQVSGMYDEWFLDYASYVILERAVPHLHDGLKPVQRRILHSLKEMDDGRFHKVANAIGNTMKYHPHGDASIGDAMVQIGQKELFLDVQGNWGNVVTGDRAAAPRYIEVKLSKFANEVAFNAKTTNWLASYDGRNKEPETLPMKFPLLLAQGVEGIAVGMACKILPHNFVELIDGSIDVLRGKRTHVLPDFLTGGMADFSNYNEGLRGGKVKVRARIRKEDNKTLVIYEIPFGSTTSSLIDSILKANDKNKIKIKKIEDNTAENVEVVIHLPNGVSPDKTIDALYAFTDCEISISPNAAVIEEDRPKFLGVNDMLRISTERTKDLLRQELEIKKGELEEQWQFASLEKIFIENRIYRDIEECETWEDILDTIHKGLKPFVQHLLREVTDEDVTRLTEIRIKRISKFDAFKADERIRSLDEQIEEVKGHLAQLTDYAIAYFKRLKERYAAGRERKTEIKLFDSIDRSNVAVANVKLYVNREEGFAGFDLKRSDSEFVCECSDIDDIIVIREDGVMTVTKVSPKAFLGKGILYVGVWKKGDNWTVYNAIYRDGKAGRTMVKRFHVTSITRDKEYFVTKGAPDSKVLYLSVNPNGEAEVVTVHLRQQPKVKRLKWDLDFSEQAIKGRSAGGNMVTKYPVKRIELKEKGVSTLGARKIWYDETVQRLNVDGRGRLLGAFQPDDRILVLLDDGRYKLVGFDVLMHFDENMIHLEKWLPEKPLTAVYYDGAKKLWYVKRFLAELSGKAVTYISEHPDSKAGVISTAFHPAINIRFNKKFKHTRDKEDERVELLSFVSVKGLKANGKRLTQLPITEVELLPLDEEKEKAAAQAFLAAARAKQEVEKEEVADDVSVEEEDEGQNEPDEAMRESGVSIQVSEPLKKKKAKHKKGMEPAPVVEDDEVEDKADEGNVVELSVTEEQKGEVHQNPKDIEMEISIGEDTKEFKEVKAGNKKKSKGGEGQITLF